MIKAYPVIIGKGTEFFVVSIPDFNINTQGKDITEAILMAREAIGIIGIDMEDDGQELPVPSAIENVKTSADGIVTLVDVDFTEYRRKNDMRTVKKNCTIPSWLNYAAEKAGINFSTVLQEGLKRELQIKE